MTIHGTKEDTTKDTSTAMALTPGLMALSMRETGTRIGSKVKVSTIGKTEESTVVIGLTIICMDTENING
jgi:hypothetical protein